MFLPEFIGKPMSEPLNGRIPIAQFAGVTFYLTVQQRPPTAANAEMYPTFQQFLAEPNDRRGAQAGSSWF